MKRRAFLQAGIGTTLVGVAGGVREGQAGAQSPVTATQGQILHSGVIDPHFARP